MLLSGVGLLALFFSCASAQDSIINIDVPVNVSLPYEFGSINLSFDLKADATEQRALYDVTWELMAGTQEQAGNNVVDIIFIETTTMATSYYFPASIPNGAYHIRINATTNTTSGPSSVQNLSARSPTMQLTHTFECKDPGPYPNVSSPTDAAFTSLVVSYPYPGQVFHPSKEDIQGFHDQFDYGYRDARNTFGAGIANLSFEYLKVQSDGSLTHIKTYPGVSSDGALQYDWSDAPFTLGIFKLRVNYTNQLQDGAVQPGGVVSWLSQEMYISGPDGTAPCQGGVPGPNSKSSSAYSGRAEVRIWALVLVALTIFMV